MPIDRHTHLPHSATMATWLAALQLDITRQEESTNSAAATHSSRQRYNHQAYVCPEFLWPFIWEKKEYWQIGLWLFPAWAIYSLRGNANQKKVSQYRSRSLMQYVIRIHTHHLTLSFRLYSHLRFCGGEDSHGCHEGSYNSDSKHWSKHMVSTSLLTLTHAGCASAMCCIQVPVSITW